MVICVVMTIVCHLIAADLWETFFLFVVDLLSLIVSKKEIDMSLLTVLVMVGYSSLFESTISTYGTSSLL